MDVYKKAIQGLNRGGDSFGSECLQRLNGEAAIRNTCKTIQQFLQAKREWVHVRTEGTVGLSCSMCRKTAWLGTMVVRSLLSHVLEEWGSLLLGGYWVYPECRRGAFLNTCTFPWPSSEPRRRGKSRKAEATRN